MPWDPAATESSPAPSFAGENGNFVVSSNGLFAWRADIPATFSAPAHEEIHTAKKTEQRGGGPPPALGSVILAAAPMPDPSAPPFAALSFRSACRLTWTTATGVSTPSEANVCAAAATP